MPESRQRPGPPEEPVIPHAERGAGGVEFPDPVLAEQVTALRAQVGQVSRDDLTQLAQGAGDQRHRDASGRVPGHGGAGLDRFVVGVGVHQQQPAPPSRGCSHAARLVGGRGYAGHGGRIGAMTESFPRQQARTRRFTLGVPRSFQVAPDGSRVAFLRSQGGTDPVTCLWQLHVDTGHEELVADPAALDRPARTSPRRRRPAASAPGSRRGESSGSPRTGLRAWPCSPWPAGYTWPTCRLGRREPGTREPGTRETRCSRLGARSPALDPRPDPDRHPDRLRVRRARCT